MLACIRVDGSAAAALAPKFARFADHSRTKRRSARDDAWQV
jgi:hypothetical protein